MTKISNKEYEEYQHQANVLHSRMLTPDGLRIICAGFDNEPQKIGKYMLGMNVKLQSENRKNF